MKHEKTAAAIFAATAIAAAANPYQTMKAEPDGFPSLPLC